MRRRLRFRLLSLMIVIAVCALAFAGVTARRRWAENRREAAGHEQQENKLLDSAELRLDNALRRIAVTRLHVHRPEYSPPCHRPTLDDLERILGDEEEALVRAAGLLKGPDARNEDGRRLVIEAIEDAKAAHEEFLTGYQRLSPYRRPVRRFSSIQGHDIEFWNYLSGTKYFTEIQDELRQAEEHAQRRRKLLTRW